MLRCKLDLILFHRKHEAEDIKTQKKHFQIWQVLWIFLKQQYHEGLSDQSILKPSLSFLFITIIDLIRVFRFCYNKISVVKPVINEQLDEESQSKHAHGETK